ncbi:XRE family transcriptional regulator [soil metagenome]|jgi:transcriptional regulator with XRE-family HTH domain
MAGSAAEDATAASVGNLGSRLRRVRQASGMSLREVSRQLGVSASWVSQIENGKSQPSVAMLYSISQLLNVSIDELFSVEDVVPVKHPAPPQTEQSSAQSAELQPSGFPISRSGLGSPSNAWSGVQPLARLSVTRPGERHRLEMDSGVVWEQLATTTGTDVDFMEIVYPPHSTSTTDKRMLQHAGSEFGYLLEGELEITVGFEAFTVSAGDALGFDSAMPHLLSNKTDFPARGVWFVLHPHV